MQEQAQARFQAHMDNPREGKALPSEYAVPVYKIVLKTGGQRQFDQVLAAVSYLVRYFVLCYIASCVVFLVCCGVLFSPVRAGLCRGKVSI